MIRNKFLSGVLLMFTLTSYTQHPFKYDNTVYKAVYLIEAFRIMDTMQSYLLLDVRSPGEYADTSRATALNIGRIKGSVNITSDSVSARLPELKKYIDKPIFIYCSHSQRSRRISKLLAENGFRQVYNINGGMTLVNELDATEFPYKNKYLITNLAYKNINSSEAYHLIKETPGLVIIDIRTESEFASKDSVQQNNIGHLKNAINIPQAQFADKFDSYRIPQGSPILVYDQKGYNSMDVVDIMKAKGFNQIYNLFEGLQVFISSYELNKGEINSVVTNPPPFQILDTKECIELLQQSKELVILDTRSADEFQNKASMSHMNLGRIKGSVNIPTLASLNGLISSKNPSTRFLVYGSGSDLGTLVCQELVKKGFKQVYYLGPGLYRFVWSTANIKDCRAGRDYLTDHEGLY